MRNTKEINIKDRTYNFLDDITNTKHFDPSLLKIHKKSYKNTDIYDIGYNTIKDSDYVKVNTVNPLYLIIWEVYGYIEESNANKYLTFASMDGNRKVSNKYTELWIKSK